MDRAGIYIHIPFCLKKCAYCDFYSVEYNSRLADAYVDSLIAELSRFDRREIDTVYFGGGTPSLLASEQVSRILSAINDRMVVCDGAEITLEANPATADKRKLADFRSAGVNRLSVGIQSTDDRSLGVLGRLHNKAEAFSFISDAISVGFSNISADIMLALPGDNRHSTEKTVSEIAALPLTHISAYLLKIMEGTPFYENTPKNLPDDDGQASLYELSCDILEKNGFHQYEISNFAKSDSTRSRHNLKYWNCEDYIGLGAAAHSSLGGKRYSYPRDLVRFISAFGSPSAKPDEAVLLSSLAAEGSVDYEDYIMLRLRTTSGLPLTDLYSLYNFCFDEISFEKIAVYEKAGLLKIKGDNIALTRKGLLVSNSIISELI